MAEHLTPDQLERGAAYRLDGRRQSFGVWNGKVLLGLQWEFGSIALSHESHWDQGGSAKVLERVARVPDTIELVSSWTQCAACGTRATFDRDLNQYEHSAGPADHVADVKGSRTNRELLEWLVNLERKLGSL